MHPIEPRSLKTANEKNKKENQLSSCVVTPHNCYTVASRGVLHKHTDGTNVRARTHTHTPSPTHTVATNLHERVRKVCWLCACALAIGMRRVENARVGDLDIIAFLCVPSVHYWHCCCCCIYYYFYFVLRVLNAHSA